MFRWLVRPDCAALILRLVLAGIFLMQGWLKISEFEGGTAWYLEANDTMPPAVQAMVAWGELLCGLALALGLLTRVAALGIIAIMLGAIYKVTWKLDFTSLPVRNRRGFVVHEVGYEYNYAIIAMCASLIILGAGILSLDHLIWRRRGQAAALPAGAPSPGARV